MSLQAGRLVSLQAVKAWLTSVCATAASSSSSSSCTRRSSWAAVLERRGWGCLPSPKSASTSVFPFVCRPGGHSLVTSGSLQSAGKAERAMCSTSSKTWQCEALPQAACVAGHKAVKITIAAVRDTARQCGSSEPGPASISSGITSQVSLQLCPIGLGESCMPQASCTACSAKTPWQEHHGLSSHRHCHECAQAAHQQQQQRQDAEYDEGLLEGLLPLWLRPAV